MNFLIRLLTPRCYLCVAEAKKTNDRTALCVCCGSDAK